ncbi:MAG: hypothetical protein ACE5E6_12045 [Phycisphaerae bacterium]
MRLVLWFTLGGFVLLGVVRALAPRFFAPADASAVVAAAAICTGVGLGAMIPLALVGTRCPAYIIQAGMGAMTLRILLTLVVGSLYLWICVPPRATFFNAMVVSYLVLLAVETAATAWMVKLHWRPPPSSQP